MREPRIEANHALLEEIRDVNQRLIDTVVSISDEEVDPSAAAPAQSLAIGTPGISASPLLAEFTSPDGAHGSRAQTPSVDLDLHKIGSREDSFTKEEIVSAYAGPVSTCYWCGDQHEMRKRSAVIHPHRLRP
ncbi:hypothetical protein KIW84_022025 [Lathyrus oleraceus]|uniref:Uncharacterized protein n=1 Tax=Pisum sativum TaxID=3888 RepID=A0A9D4Y9E2_PEA|nr:hypothetical protein KIW84_022025 [Pisum sativum]